VKKTFVLGLTACAAVLGILVGGCAGSARSSVGAGTDSISAAELPSVPGCDTAARRPGGISVTPVADVADLYLVLDDGTPLCLDSLENIDARFADGLDLYASNPMPGRISIAASNPMPGKAASNPMPGKTASNPLPGSNDDGTPPPPR
jgi:hypothetical protein